MNYMDYSPQPHFLLLWHVHFSHDEASEFLVVHHKLSDIVLVHDMLELKQLKFR